MPNIAIHIDFVNYATLMAHMANLRNNVIKACDLASSEIVELGINEIHGRLYPGPGYRTGRLYHSYEKSREGVGSPEVTMTWQTGLYYAPYVEYRWGGKISHFRPAMSSMSQAAPSIVELHFSRIF